MINSSGNSHNGASSLYLNGGLHGMIGIAKSYKVYPGDKVAIDAWGKYHNPGGSGNNLASFATALLGAFNLSPPGGGETGTPSAGINTFGGFEAGGFDDGSTDNTDTKAFATIVMFDKNYNFLDVAYAQLVGPADTYEHMTPSYTVKEAGYVYMYVSNENTTPINVYYDDVIMSYTPSNVIQYNEYYPFGLQTANSWTRDNTINSFLYDAGNELNATTGWYETFFRGYDPALGRFHQVDPMADMYGSHTPYNYAGNNPASISDPTGAVWSQDMADNYLGIDYGNKKLR